MAGKHYLAVATQFLSVDLQNTPGAQGHSFESEGGSRSAGLDYRGVAEYYCNRVEEDHQ